MTQLTLSLPGNIQTYIDKQLADGEYEAAEELVIQLLLLQARTLVKPIVQREFSNALEVFQDAGLVRTTSFESLSFLDQADDLIGCVEGLGNLSTNFNYMEDFDICEVVRV